MVDRRLELQALLESVLGLPNVYFQPPHNFEVEYPCFVYSLDDIDSKHANNNPYKLTREYLITHISREIDDEMLEAMTDMVTATFVRRFPKDGLNHAIFELTF